MKKSVRIVALAMVVLSVMMISAPVQAATCTQDYILAVQECSELDSFWDRSACGLDAAAEYAGCMRRTIMG